MGRSSDLPLPGHNAGGCDQLNGIAQRGVARDRAQEILGQICHLHVLFLAADVEDVAHLLLGIGRGVNDEEAVQQVNGDTVGRLVVGSPDFGDPPVGGHDHEG